MKKITTEIIVMLFATLFLYTGISKLMEYTVFKEQLAGSPILAPFSKFIAGGLPWLEFLITVLLIVPRFRLKGFYAALILMSIFTIYIILMLNFSEDLPCSCGGVLAQLSWTQHIIFNSVFIALALTGGLLEKRTKRSKPHQSTIGTTPLKV